MSLPSSSSVTDLVSQHGEHLSAHVPNAAIEAMHSIVPIIAIISTFGLPLLIVLAVFAFRLRRQRMLNDVILRLAEKGQPVPPELFSANGGMLDSGNDGRRGILWMAIGLGIFAFGAFDGDSDVMGIGCIPLFIGLGFFVAYQLGKRDRKSDDDRTPPSSLS